MTQITDIKSRLIYNSRGSETIEVEVSIDNIIGIASSPAGASVGKFEAVAFRNTNCKDTAVSYTHLTLPTILLV